MLTKEITTENSTHRVEVVRVGELEKHPNADRLEIIRIFGYTCCVGKGQYKPGDLVAYVCPDSICPDTPEFAFLGDHKRVKVKKLRGVFSQGLIVPAPLGAEEGDNVAAQLGVTHYNPPLPMSTGGEAEKPPLWFCPVYDVDSWYRYNHIFQEGEEVKVSEKIHGASARYCYQDGRMRCGSRTEWKKESEENIWWKALRANPDLELFCREFEDITVYGEVYGQVQDLKYGTPRGHVRFAAFDLLRGNEWISHKEIVEKGLDKWLRWVPSLYVGPYDKDKIRALADGPSVVEGADHIREGVVVKPTIERTCLETGRVQLKIVSNNYLERH